MNLLSTNLLSTNLLSALLDNQKLVSLLPQISLVAVAASVKLGAIMPLVVSLINQPRFSKRQKSVWSVLSCLAASGIICLASGALSGINWVASVVVLLSVTWGLYARFYKPTGICPWFEQATELSKLVPLLLALFGVNGVKASGALDSATRQADQVEVPDPTPTDAPTPSAPNPTPTDAP